MMKKFTLVVLFFVCTCAAFSATFTITFSGFTFSPATISVSAGDTINFTLASNHNAVEVSLATWNANGTTSNGGFNIPFNGGQLLTSTLSPGDHYYVCTNHVSFGMKGKITVLVSGINEQSLTEKTFVVYPNPIVFEKLNVSYHLSQSAMVELNVYDVLGKRVAQLLSKEQMPGDYVSAYDVQRKRYSQGIYVIELVAGEKKTMQRVMIY